MSNDLRTLRTFLRHLTEVRRGLLLVMQDLERRATLHDLSKLEDDEFPGFVKVQAVKESGDARRESAVKDVLSLHHGRNRHHPEYYSDAASEMGWLDIIEMVVDWRAAWKAYGSTDDWMASVEAQRLRYGMLSDSQWWLVEQIAVWLSEKEV